jgi:hypothetical protein
LVLPASAATSLPTSTDTVNVLSTFAGLATKDDFIKLESKLEKLDDKLEKFDDKLDLKLEKFDDKLDLRFNVLAEKFDDKLDLRFNFLLAVQFTFLCVLLAVQFTFYGFLRNDIMAVRASQIPGCSPVPDIPQGDKACTDRSLSD